jgi:hypothetical protein
MMQWSMLSTLAPAEKRWPPALSAVGEGGR